MQDFFHQQYGVGYNSYIRCTSRVVRAFLEGPYASMGRGSTNLAWTERIWWTPIDSCKHAPQTTAVQLFTKYIDKMKWMPLDAFETPLGLQYVTLTPMIWMRARSQRNPWNSPNHAHTVRNPGTYCSFIVSQNFHGCSIFGDESHPRICGITIWCYLCLNPWALWERWSKGQSHWPTNVASAHDCPRGQSQCPVEQQIFPRTSLLHPPGTVELFGGHV